MANELILVVDDDITTVRYCQRLLERESYRVATAATLSDGLAILRDEHVDLLLSDIIMPGLDGFELIKQAKLLQPDLPVVIVTGHGSVENAILALNRGADGLLIKPIPRRSELTSLVKRVLEEGRQRSDALRLRALRPLFDVTERLLTETSPDVLEGLILQNTHELLSAPVVGFCFFDPSKKSLASLRLLNLLENEQLDSSHIEQIIHSFCNKQMAVVMDVDNQSWPSNGRLKDARLATFIATSVQRENRCVFFAFRELGEPVFTEADLETLTIMARQAIVALENARLYAELRDTIKTVEESQQTIIQMEKMAAIGRMTASIAHEINNPLQAVRNCLHLAERNIETAQRTRYLQMMDTEMDRLVNTVTQMLDFYRVGGDNQEDFDLQLIINQVLELLQPQFRGQHIQAHFHRTNQAYLIRGAPGQIQQVLFNLLINAIEAFQDENPPSREKRNIWVDIESCHSDVVVTVEDSGPGISSSLNKQVFEPFFSTKPKGTGLGLSISYGIVERHQGSLTLIESKHGHGACFEIKLPIQQKK